MPMAAMQVDSPTKSPRSDDDEADMQGVATLHGDTDVGSARHGDTDVGSDGGSQRGRLIVRCVRGTKLPKLGLGQVLSTHRSKAYVELFLRDEASRLRTPSKRTGVIPKTGNPIWNQEFTFAVKRATAALTLHLVLWDHDVEREDISLGKATLTLGPELLRQASQTRQVRDLPLSEHDERSHLPIMGKAASVRVEVGWEPQDLKLAGAGDTVTIWRMIRMPPVLRVVAIAMSGWAGLLLAVATASRWLCTAEGERGCKAATVPGTTTSCVMAATLQITVFFVHFLGAAGVITSELEEWSHLPPSLMSLADTGLGQESHTQSLVDPPQEFSVEVTIRPEVQVGTLGGAHIGANISLCPKVRMSAIRVFIWLMQASVLFLSFLAWLLAWLEDGPTRRIAEGAYLDGVAMALILFSVLLFRKADRRQDKLEKWVYHTTPKASEDNGATLLEGLPNQLEDVLASTRIQMERQRELFEERMRDMTERVQSQFSEGPSKMQANLSMLQEAAQPLLATLQRGSLIVPQEPDAQPCGQPGASSLGGAPYGDCHGHRRRASASASAHGAAAARPPRPGSLGLGLDGAARPASGSADGGALAGCPAPTEEYQEAGWDDSSPKRRGDDRLFCGC